MHGSNGYTWQLGPSPNCVPGLWSKSYHYGNSQMETSEIILTKVVNQKHYHIPWRGVAKMSTSIEDLKDAAMVAPITFPLHYSGPFKSLADPGE